MMRSTSALSRDVTPEWLDSLAPDDPRAIRSRRDLRLVNWLMATRVSLAASLDKVMRNSGPVRIVELGAGDGRLLLSIARRRARRWPRVSLELLDMQPIVSDETLAQFRALGWDASVICADVFDWLARSERRDDTPVVIVANLFMHHFDGQRLRDLVNGIALRCKVFICCEPRRSRLALMFSRLLGVIGCNDVTRHDAVASVRAGFRANELTTFWPTCSRWAIEERLAGPFIHLFRASIDDAATHP